jgi:hypothetical protein
MHLQQFIVQMFTNWMSSISFCAPMSLYVTMVVSCSTQLEKIQTALLDIKQRKEEMESVIKDRLAQCVQHHQKVLRSDSN